MKPIPLVMLALSACAPEPPAPPAPANVAAPAPTPAAVPPAAVAVADSGVTPALAELSYFRDWAVACDNGGGCEAASMAPGEGNLQDIGLILRRPAGPDGRLTATVRATGDQTGAFDLLVDGRPVGIAVRLRDAEPTLIEAAEAARIAEAITGARTLELRNGDLRVPISIAGVSAALRYMDDRQGRAGTVTALVARGDRPGDAVPPAPVLPTVVAAPLDRSPPPALTPELVTRMRRDEGCVIGEVGGPEDVGVHALGGGKALVLLSCGSGAYNAGAAPLILAGDRFTKAAFDRGYEWGEPGSGTRIVNGAWDPRTGRLTSAARGRGLGDCGASSEWGWDGARFRLVGARTMGECRGAVAWLTVWRARVERR